MQKSQYSLSRHPLLKVILKYKNHPSMIIKGFSPRFSSFCFWQVDKNILLEDIKISQSSVRHIPLLQEY